MNIEFRHFLHFIAIVEAKGIRQAARTVNISPSSLTRSLKLLEEHYNTPLLERQGKQMVPTPHGEQALKEFKLIQQGVESIKPKLEQLDSLEQGTLRVGVNPTIADIILPQLATRFIKEHPKVEISVIVREATQLAKILAAGGLDLIVGLDSVLEMNKTFEVTSILKTEALWWVRSGHPLLTMQKCDFSDLASYPLLSQHIPASFAEHIRALCLKSNIKSRAIAQTLQCDDYNTLHSITAQSDAILIGHSYIDSHNTRELNLCKLQVDVSMPNATFSVALPLLPTPSPLARRYVELLREEIAGLRVLR